MTSLSNTSNVKQLGKRPSYLQIVSWNLKDITNEAIRLFSLEHSTLTTQEKADALGISCVTYVKKAIELGISIPKIRDKNKKVEFFELLDSAELNTNIIVKNYAETTVRNYTNDWLREQPKLLGATISTIAAGVCVYLYEKTTTKTKKTIVNS